MDEGPPKKDKDNLVKGEFGKKKRKDINLEKSIKRDDLGQPYFEIGITDETRALMMARALEIENYLKGTLMDNWLRKKNYKNVTEVPHVVVEDVEKKLDKLIRAAKGRSVLTAESLLAEAEAGREMWSNDPIFYLGLARTLKRMAETL